eukprot:6449437-Ditylum_brightwellii.AAC.1
MVERYWTKSSSSMLVWTSGKLTLFLRVNFSTLQCGRVRHSFHWKSLLANTEMPSLPWRQQPFMYLFSFQMSTQG